MTSGPRRRALALELLGHLEAGRADRLAPLALRLALAVLEDMPVSGEDSGGRQGSLG